MTVHPFPDCSRGAAGDAMELASPQAFGPFHVDDTQGGLWRGEQRLALRPQSLALLRSLVAHPGRLVTKAEVRQHMWLELRAALSLVRLWQQHGQREAACAFLAPLYIRCTEGLDTPDLEKATTLLAAIEPVGKE